jgi:hypothetical protein
VRTAALGVGVFGPLALSIAGVLAILLGSPTIGVGLLIAGLVLRLVAYLAVRRRGRFANPS